LDFQKFEILTVCLTYGANVRQFSQCWPSAILDFWKFDFLTVWAVKKTILHNRAKFCEDLPMRCCDFAIFVVFQDGGRRHLGF